MCIYHLNVTKYLSINVIDRVETYKKCLWLLFFVKIDVINQSLLMITVLTHRQIATITFLRSLSSFILSFSSLSSPSTCFFLHIYQYVSYSLLFVIQPKSRIAEYNCARERKSMQAFDSNHMISNLISNLRFSPY